MGLRVAQAMGLGKRGIGSRTVHLACHAFSHSASRAAVCRQHSQRVLQYAEQQDLLMQVFLTPEYLAISMEYAKGGDMFQYVKAKGGLQVAQAFNVSFPMRYWPVAITVCILASPLVP